MKRYFKSELISIMFDSWKNPVNSVRHVCVMLYINKKVFYWSSVEMEEQSGDKLYEHLNTIILELQNCGAKVLCCVSDNARNMQKIISIKKEFGRVVAQNTLKQAVIILKIISTQLMIIQKDEINVLDVICAFRKIYIEWFDEITSLLSISTINNLRNIWKNRWIMFEISNIGIIIRHFRYFFNYDSINMFTENSDLDDNIFNNWVEESNIQEKLALRLEISFEKLPVHNILFRML
ncbi:hypothetical protein A3Q56_04823 [Intoshia linei]|uniref:DUF659 domain-containing protein n=1 Tax=Intoshia linei TaxID=1819745 RepID=A0A177B1Y8_9BILA|nr:hypothetical protein A3Q56_04823 [Intoshia linei]